ncbi:hypothetical protein [Gordonia soli]|uniref:hypothetical protein n=1 Tax=Gordonia soli TaxID=320799 RepID=UPI00058E90A5|nr:hypothetical protein [Gordonia soli]
MRSVHLTASVGATATGPRCDDPVSAARADVAVGGLGGRAGEELATDDEVEADGALAGAESSPEVHAVNDNATVATAAISRATRR